MVALLTILGTIFLIVGGIFWSGRPKLSTVDIAVASVATILMTLCYEGWNFKDTLDLFTFVDGTPFGVKVEE